MTEKCVKKCLIPAVFHSLSPVYMFCGSLRSDRDFMSVTYQIPLCNYEKLIVRGN